MQTTYNNRTYIITRDDNDLPSLRAHLESNGWDGHTYTGISTPTGRQRGVKQGIFYRNAKTGEFVQVVGIRA